MRQRLCTIVLIICALALVGCGELSAQGSDSTGPSEEVWPSDLTDADLIIVNDINSESHLVCKLYEEIEAEEEPYEVLGDSGSSAVAVKIPKSDGPLHMKEIDICDPGYDLYGMKIGDPKELFEAKMAAKGFAPYQHLDSIRHESFLKENIYISINYDENELIDRIFINLLLDYNEWRAIE